MGMLGEKIGKQDQYAVARGGLNRFRFYRGGEVDALPLLAPNCLRKHLMMFFTWETRNTRDILKEQAINLKKASWMNMAGIKGQVELGGQYLLDGDMQEFGRLLDVAWVLKKEVNPLSTTPAIDEAYRKALDAGAWGGKICGAGGGGFLLICAPPDKHQAIREAVGMWDMAFEFTYKGSEVIYKG
jgi:D-glycero-alpha-D-manno-heptose-7-phosphate kinase